MMYKLLRKLATLAIVTFALIACEAKDDFRNPEVDMAYVAENQEFMREKALEKNTDGTLKYSAVVYGAGGVDNTVLFCVLEEGTSTISPSLDSDIEFKDMEGRLKCGRVFQDPFSATFAPQELIIGLREALLMQHIGEKLETIIPANLGYGFNPLPGIPVGSALIFTYTIIDISK